MSPLVHAAASTSATNSIITGQKRSGSSIQVKWPAPLIASSLPTPPGRASTISSAAATGVMGSSSPTQTSVGRVDAVELIDDVEPDEPAPRPPTSSRA